MTKLERAREMLDYDDALLTRVVDAMRRAANTLDTSMVRWNIAGQMGYREDCREARDGLTKLIDEIEKGRK